MHDILEFILPVLAASAEGVIWVLIVVILVVVGRGKILPSEKPLIIERQGRYKMDLAPGLNLAQPFIEAIADLVPLREDTRQDGLMLCFEVRDKNIASRKKPFYLLNITLHNGYLSFDARHAPQEPVSPNSASVAYHGQTVRDDIENVIQAVAKRWGIGLHRIG